MKRLCIGCRVFWVKNNELGFSCGWEKFERYSVEVSENDRDGFIEVSRWHSLKRAGQQLETVAADVKLQNLDAEVIVRVVDLYTGYECGLVNTHADLAIVVSGYVGRRKI